MPSVTRRRVDVAAVAGVVLRHLLAVGRRAAPHVPGALGALSLAYGLGLVYRPLVFIVAGAFLVLVDRRMP